MSSALSHCGVHVACCVCRSVGKRSNVVTDHLLKQCWICVMHASCLWEDLHSAQTSVEHMLYTLIVAYYSLALFVHLVALSQKTAVRNQSYLLNSRITTMTDMTTTTTTFQTMNTYQHIHCVIYKHITDHSLNLSNLCRWCEINWQSSIRICHSSSH